MLARRHRGTLGALAIVSWLGLPEGEKPDPGVPDSAFEFLLPLRGESGELRVVFRTPGSTLTARGPASGISVLYEGETGDALASDRVPTRPGVYDIVLKAGDRGRKAGDLRLVTLVPFTEKRQGRIGPYEVGSWPFETGKPRSQAYANPPGFVEVTRENRALRVSKHFELGDFLTKGQEPVWPKYLVLDARLLDKLELVAQELEASGTRADRFHVMSGFRTPAYNELGGDPSGRGELSRHMWGDAADIWVDNDRDGAMDDLNGDKRVDFEDSRAIAAAAERVEARYPALAGGIAPYPACCGHGPFTHVDARGARARWEGARAQAPTPKAGPAQPAPRADRD